MVPPIFFKHNVNKLSKLLVSSLNRIGRLLYFIGYPLYSSSYRTLRRVIKNVKKIRKINKNTYLSYHKKLLKIWDSEVPIDKVFVHARAYTKNVFNRFFTNSRDSKEPSFKKILIEDNENKILLDLLTKFYNLSKNELIKSRKKLNLQINNIKNIKNKGALEKRFHQIKKFTDTEIKKYFPLFYDLVNRSKKNLRQKSNSFVLSLHGNKKNVRGWIKKADFIKNRKKIFNHYRTSSKFYKKTVNKIKQLPRPRIKWATYGLITLLIIVLFSGLSFWTLVLKDLPSADQLTARQIEASTKIYDRNGILLYKIYNDQNRTPVPLSQIPDHVKNATLAIEDSDFYSHPGFSIKGITRALFRNYQRGELAGGSTITQQLVKNVLLSSEKTFIRKLKEIVLAVQVEMMYEKDKILEMYLNEVSYGGTAYGIQEASKMYFDKNVEDLTLTEAALLAGLPKSPTEYSPFGSNPTAAENRQKEVLRLMEENYFITSEQRLEAEQEKLVYANNQIDIKAPHFVMYVREILENKYGKEMVEKGGLEVHTTLDYEIQQQAEKFVQEEVASLSRLNVGNGSAVVLSPSTGEILAMVGSKNYFDIENDGNVNVATSLRQPGSSIKIVNYAYALSNGFTPASIIEDSPATFLVNGSPPYDPKNYDGQYRGRLTLRSALAESRNVPAVKLLNSYGVDKMIQLGEKMGISTWKDRSRFGLSLTLGGGEVKLTELAQVYATVANYGKRPNLVSILKVTDYQGKVLDVYECDELQKSTLIAVADKLSSDVQASQAAIKIPFTEPGCDGEQVLDPRVAFMLTDILKDNEARTPAFGSNSMLNIPGHKEVAVKTGTSNDLRDNLTIGYNQNFLVAVWVGNNDNTPMSRVASGITGASPIFNKIMTYLVKDYSNHDWEVPGGLVQLPTCPYTGTLACSGCPTKMEWFLEENQPTQRCSAEWFRQQDENEENNNGDGNEENNNGNNNNRRRNNRIPEWIRERF